LEKLGIIAQIRKGRVLTASDFGCLKGIPTLNVTNGCLFQCAYCYARGYSQAPRKGEVRLYVNLPDLLKEELARKRNFPAWLIINTASDCFQPYPDILLVTHQVMQILLEGGIGISFLTKGGIPKKFFDLFRRFPEKVLAQIGMVSLSERYWKEYEPYAAASALRIQNIYNLRATGIIPEVRMDPIIPFLTDTEIETTGLLEKLKETGIQKVTLSYLHLRPAIQEQLMKELSPLHQKLIEACFQGSEWKEVGASTQTKLLPQPIRENGYSRIQKIAEKLMIQAVVCQCKNPDLKGDLCGSGRVRKAIRERTSAQLPLFLC